MSINNVTLDELEQDQQQLIEKSDIKTLANHCLSLQNLENEISDAEEKLKELKKKADNISSEIIPELLAEQGL